MVKSQKISAFQALTRGCRYDTLTLCVPFFRGDKMRKEVNLQQDNKPKEVNPKSRNVKSDNSKQTIAKQGQGLQYVGISLTIAAFIIAIIIVNFSGAQHFTENIIMSVAMGISIVFITLSYTTVAIVIGAASIVGFIGIKVFGIMMASGTIEPLSFLWILAPVMAIVGMYLYVSGNSSFALENALLKKQIAELVMTDPVTGLYNLRSMFMDIQTQISYSERNKTAISLMIIRLRYPDEMKKVLKPSEYQTVVKQLSLLLVDTVRLEDKVYSIDDNGGFGIILTCDRKGTKLVEKRLRTKLEDPKWFENVSDKHQVRTEVKVGYLQYDAKYNRDANAFKEDVEAEVEYDV